MKFQNGFPILRRKQETSVVWRYAEKLIKDQRKWLAFQCSSEKGPDHHLFALFLLSTNTRFRSSSVIWRIQNRNFPLFNPYFPLLQSPRKWPQMGRKLGRMCRCLVQLHGQMPKWYILLMFDVKTFTKIRSGRKVYAVPLPRIPVQFLIFEWQKILPI